MSLYVSTLGPDVAEQNTTSADKIREFKGEGEDQITALAFSSCNAEYAKKIAEFYEQKARAIEAADAAIEAEAENKVEGGAPEEKKELY